MFDKIIVLDFGSQYNQLIARRIRDMHVYSELLPHTIKAEEIKEMGNVKGIVFSGGPKSVYDVDAFDVDPQIFELGIPVLGICYGMQLISKKFGGKISRGSIREYGLNTINIIKDSLLFDSLPKEQDVWMSHGDHVEVLPNGFDLVAKSSAGLVASIENTEKNIYAVQFHPEVRNSVYGLDIIKNFVFKICKANDNWSMANYINMQIEKIRAEVGDKKVLCGLSGGVDSTVVAVLLSKAIGKQLTCMFIDHGLLRKNEGDLVMESLKPFDMNVIKIDAKNRFLTKLKDVEDPEAKRKIIGNEFIYCFDEESKKLGEFDYLAQGTLYTDVIESGTGTAQRIKAHHNVGGLPKDMKFKLIEPLNILFKDEVRALGLELGLPYNIVWRQPFPGPGLGIRIIGEVTADKVRIVQDADAIYREEIANAGLDRSIGQYFAALTNMRSVGVMGDERTYDYAIALRAVNTIDFMTAESAQIPYEVLNKVMSRIINEVRGVNRVMYDLTSKPPGTIEFE